MPSVLRKFLYLDTDALDDYLDALEDGRRQGITETDRSGRSLGGRLGTSSVGASGERSSDSEVTSQRTDTAPARFQRLLDLAAEDEDWAELQDPSQLADIGYGTLVHLECDAYVPDVVRTLGDDQLPNLLGALSALAPTAETLGLDMEGMPDLEQIDAMQKFASALKADLVLVGDGEDDDGWRIAGRLDRRYLLDREIDGFVRVVGKVSERWPENRWKPLLALPGASLVPRAQRRQMEREKPADGEEDNYLRGPAVMLDLLAVYR